MSILDTSRYGVRYTQLHDPACSQHHNTNPSPKSNPSFFAHTCLPCNVCDIVSFDLQFEDCSSFTGRMITQPRRNCSFASINWARLRRSWSHTTLEISRHFPIRIFETWEAYLSMPTASKKAPMTSWSHCFYCIHDDSIYRRIFIVSWKRVVFQGSSRLVNREFNTFRVKCDCVEKEHVVTTYKNLRQRRP